MITPIQGLDTSLLHALFAMRDPGTVVYAIWISEFGRAFTIYALSACVILLLVFRRSYARAAGLAITVISAGFFTLLLKGLVARGRPPLDFQAYREIWWSFPSAHAALSAAFYGYLAALAWSARSPIIRYGGTIGAIALILLIGLSRLYLGVHYLSDVVVGYFLGAACVWLGIRIARIIHPS